MKTLDCKLIRDLLHMRGQVLAVALVVACGIAAFISMRNVYESLLATQSSYYENYRFANVFVHIKRAPDTIKQDIARIPGVAVIQTRLATEVTLDIVGLDEPGAARLISIPEKKTALLNDLYLVKGRWIDANQSNEIIISAAFAEKNQFQLGDSINAIINGNWTKLRIVGIALSPEFIYEIRPGEMIPDSRRFGIIWIGQQTLSAALNMKSAFNDIVLSLTPKASEANIIEQLDLLLENYGGLGAYSREEQTSHRFISDELAQLKVNGTLIPSIFLLVAAFLIHLVLSRLVHTQREQIAVLKAFGYGNYSIAIHYLKLGIITVSFGVILGTMVGYYFGYKLTVLYTDFFHFPLLQYHFDLSVFGITILVSYISASLGAISSVRKAVLLPAAEAMRPESPIQFHTGFLENIGLQKILSLPTRIILRNITRSPIKALLTIFGIAMSVSLLVLGFYLHDAIAEIMDLQFGKNSREDANVVFYEPRPPSAIYDLMHLPGVMKVEAYRSVPIRLRFAHKMKRVALQGLEPASQLHRIVEINGNTVEIPGNGIVISKKLSEILTLKIGDKATIQVLEGKKQRLEISVVAIADEIIGLSVYMNIDSLNRLMGESKVINGARLLVDPKQADKLYFQLKHIPIISSVIIPAVVLNNFNDTIARNMGISTTITISFACIIVLGMIYNSARIALSERGRELASLRVLGFTKTEIGRMLLGEQALLTLIAIPVGYLIGYWLCCLTINSVNTELMRLPLVITYRNLALSFIVTVCSAIISAFFIQRRLNSLNLIEVLKTRE